VECYKIFADFSNNPDKYQGETEDTPMDEDQDKNTSKKRSISEISIAF
jgi:hypothetical protein